MTTAGGLAAEAIDLPAGVTLLVRGWLSSNNVVLRGKEGTAVVDTGYATHAQQTTALVERALGARTLDLLVNTHLHSDHCGGNAALQARWPDVVTQVPVGLEAEVRAWDTTALSYEPTGQQCPRFALSSSLKAGERVTLGGAAWEVFAAPGHDPDSLILFEPTSRTLISADALWESGFGVVFPELDGESAFDAVAQTLDLIENLNPRCVIPGHGAAFSALEGAMAVARSKLRFYQEAPDRHATHAAKVLLKFRLLEWQSVEISELQRWAAETDYFERIHRRWIHDQALTAWTEALIESLVNTRALRREGERVFNVGD